MRLSKRITDVFLATVGLMVMLPLFAVIAIAIKLDDGGPVFFRQKRVGRGGKEFWIWKFRTMKVDAEKIGPKITAEGDQRITRVGRLLRKLKFDELPQLVNVLRGEMSFVGPRPEVPEFVKLYTPEQRKVLELTPGITDPASLAFRNEEELLGQVEDRVGFYIREIMPQKIKINLEYASRATWWTDLKVILMTVYQVWCPISAAKDSVGEPAA